MKNHVLFYARDVLTRCAGRGNIPFNIVTADNIRRLDTVLAPVTKRVDADEDIRAFITARDEALKADDREEALKEAQQLPGHDKYIGILNETSTYKPRKYDLSRISDTLHPDGRPDGEVNLDALFTGILVLFGQVGG